MRTKIIAIDPGKVSGFATYDVITMNSFNVVEHHPPMAVVGGVETILQETTDHWLVSVERYDINNRTPSNQRDALNIIGALTYLEYKYVNITLRLQNRAERMKITDTMLKSLGWYKSTKGGHGNDAARHLLVAIRNTYPEHYLTLLGE